ncbi:hypothetical protein MPER_12970 [Moniliophthora perniciosa FA553]|nr:hypothetical protein MPER_12970 [Moniliophthora perniciosa FA553]
MIDNISRALPNTNCGKNTQVRCLLHIFNLVTKATVSPFTTLSKKEDPGDVDEEEEEEAGMEDQEDSAEADNGDDDPNATLPPGSVDPLRDIEDDIMLENIVEEMLALLEERDIEAFEVPEEQFAMARSTFRKSRRLGKKVHYSTPLKEELKEVCERFAITYKTLKKLVSSRWNSLHTMWDSFQHLHDALDELCDPSPRRGARVPKISKDRKLLKKWKLTDGEWHLVESIIPLLEQFIFAAQHMQTNKRPLLFQVIEKMDTLNEILEEWVRDTSKPAVIRFGAAKGLTVLDKYYAKTDDSIMYRAAMSSPSSGLQNILF